MAEYLPAYVSLVIVILYRASSAVSVEMATVSLLVSYSEEYICSNVDCEADATGGAEEKSGSEAEACSMYVSCWVTVGFCRWNSSEWFAAMYCAYSSSFFTSSLESSSRA